MGCRAAPLLKLTEGSNVIVSSAEVQSLWSCWVQGASLTVGPEAWVSLGFISSYSQRGRVGVRLHGHDWSPQEDAKVVTLTVAVSSLFSPVLQQSSEPRGFLCFVQLKDFQCLHSYCLQDTFARKDVHVQSMTQVFLTVESCGPARTQGSSSTWGTRV